MRALWSSASTLWRYVYTDAQRYDHCAITAYNTGGARTRAAGCGLGRILGLGYLNLVWILYAAVNGLLTKYLKLELDKNTQ